MDETKVTPEQEVKEVQEGTVEAEIKKEEAILLKEEAKPEAETVPLSVYLELKDDMKALKKDIKESKGSDKAAVVVEGVSDLAKKYPDVSQEFIEDMLNASNQIADKKYSTIIEQQEQEKKQALFDKAFDNLFDGAIKDNPDLPTNIDKDLVKTLALTPKYKNTPVADILVKMYGTAPAGKASSENDTRSAADRVEDVVSFDKITVEQKNAIMADPKARQKYFSWLDTQTGR